MRDQQGAAALLPPEETATHPGSHEAMNPGICRRCHCRTRSLQPEQGLCWRCRRNQYGNGWSRRPSWWAKHIEELARRAAAGKPVQVRVKE